MITQETVNAINKAIKDLTAQNPELKGMTCKASEDGKGWHFFKEGAGDANDPNPHNAILAVTEFVANQ
jgi:hypothetical protein